MRSAKTRRELSDGARVGEGVANSPLLQPSCVLHIVTSCTWWRYDLAETGFPSDAIDNIFYVSPKALELLLRRPKNRTRGLSHPGERSSLSLPDKCLFLSPPRPRGPSITGYAKHSAEPPAEISPRIRNLFEIGRWRCDIGSCPCVHARCGREAQLATVILAVSSPRFILSPMHRWDDEITAVMTRFAPSPRILLWDLSL